MSRNISTSRDLIKETSNVSINDDFYIKLNNGHLNYEVEINIAETLRQLEIKFQTNLNEIEVVKLLQFSTIDVSQINIDMNNKTIQFTFTKLRKCNPSANKLEFYFEVQTVPIDLCQKTKMFKITLFRRTMTFGDSSEVRVFLK